MWISIDNRHNSKLLKIPPTGCCASFWKAAINVSYLFSYEPWAAHYFPHCDLTNSPCPEFNRLHLIVLLSIPGGSKFARQESCWCCCSMTSLLFSWWVLHCSTLSNVAHFSTNRKCAAQWWRWSAIHHIRCVEKHISNLRTIHIGLQMQHLRSDHYFRMCIYFNTQASPGSGYSIIIHVSMAKKWQRNKLRKKWPKSARKPRTMEITLTFSVFSSAHYWPDQ